MHLNRLLPQEWTSVALIVQLPAMFIGATLNQLRYDDCNSNS